MYAQKHDYIWVASDDSFSTDPNYEVITIDFGKENAMVHEESSNG